MGYVQRHRVTVTTDASGDATSYTPAIQYGQVATIVYTKTDFDNGSTITVTGETTATAIWAESNVNASAIRSPRQASHSTAGVAATYDGTRAALVLIPIANERIKIVVASGGNTKTGTFDIVLV